MGIYDREYYRDETRGSGWLSGTAPVCRILILINVGVFLLGWLFRLDLERQFALQSPDLFRGGQIWRLVTAAFLHDPNNLFHLIFNMWGLWLFGREMEALYGRANFLGLYLGGAVFGNLIWALIDYFGPMPGRGILLGASGAVMAVMVVYAMNYPNREVILFVIPVPMWLLVVIFLGLDLFSLMQSGPLLGGSVVAFAAHLGGGAFGYLFKALDLRVTRFAAGRRLRPRLRVITPEPRERSTPRRGAQGATPSTPPAGRPTLTPVEPETGEQLDARVDEILAKIARDGRGALTEEENRILQEASRRARDRRGNRV